MLSSSARGFTLIELLFAVAVVAILAAVALPSFADAFYRTRRSEAVTALLQLQLAQERWRAEHATYTDSLAALELASGTGHYRLALAGADAQGYVATATATSLQAGDHACRVLKVSQHAELSRHTSIDAAGRESPAGAHGCWQ